MSMAYFYRLPALVCAVLAFQAGPAPALQQTLIAVPGTPFTSLDGIDLRAIPTVIQDHPNGSKTATQMDGQSDFFCFGPGLGQCFAGTASASAQGTAAYKTLELGISGSASASPLVYGPPFVIGTNPYVAFARSVLSVRFDDDLEIESTTLPVGTLTDYLVTMVLDSTIAGNVQATWEFQIGSTFMRFNRGVGFPVGISQDHFVLNIPLTGQVGDLVPVSMLLSAGGQASASAALGRELDAYSFNALNTATMNLDMLTPGARFRAGSNVSYASVPEPAGTALLALGLFALSARSRRR